MIVTVGGISVDMKLAGYRAGEPMMSLGHKPDGPLSRFAGGSTNRTPVNLTVTRVAGSSWDEILTPEDFARMECIARAIQERFPFTRVPYGDTGSRKPPVKAGDISLPLLAAYDTGDVSVIPHSRFLVAADHRLGRADALVRAEEDRDETASLKPVLQAVLALLAPDHGALMLHAASLTLPGGGCLFIGNSGAGKSTVAGSVDPRLVLSDDGSWCGYADGRFSLFPTPFSQIDSRPDSEGPVPLARVLFLEQGAGNRTADLSPGRAMTMLLLNHIHFFRYMGRNTAQKAFGLAGEICTRHPVSTLIFTRNFNPKSFFGKTTNERKKAV
jgi:hypothetical protein